MSLPPAGDAALPPAGLGLRRAAGVRAEASGTLLMGGSPLRVLRLSSAGAEAVAGWWAGRPLGTGAAERALARRLLDAGMAHPEPVAGTPPLAMTVVIPVRDRATALRRCLAALGAAWPVVVVDDGSADEAAIAAEAARVGATLLRLARPQGPAAARNAGLAAVRTPAVAFVDSDCEVAAGFPGRLLGLLADPALALAAPRIVAAGPGAAASGLLARYEARHSALDMGRREGLVRAGLPVPYVPAAAVVARTAALGSGFDTTLPTGEDVDLVWRLQDAGWQVRYDPAVTVAHAHRVRAAPWFARRVAYNEAAAPLARRHPGKGSAAVLSRAGAAFWAALACGRPRAAGAVTLAGSALLARALRGRVRRPAAQAVRLMVLGHAREGRHLARTLAGPWLPFVLALSAVRPRAGTRLWAGVATGALWEWLEERHEPTPLHYALPRAADDLARCVGVWRGCVRARSVRALLPVLRGR
jgi:mycofactocin system glycosyltransferase